VTLEALDVACLARDVRMINSPRVDFPRISSDDKAVHCCHRSRPRSEVSSKNPRHWVLRKRAGHILTNAHVAMSLLTPLEYWHTLQLSPRSCVIAYQFVPQKGMAEIKSPVKSILAVTGKNVVPGGVMYGGPPDLSVVSTKFDKTPYLKLSEKELPPEGTEVYFCGFPLGERMFYTEHGREQITSSLQRGIISAHLPFSGIPNPHAFVIDATCNPGNSGSAVVNPDDGSVIGVVFAKRTEAFTYAVASLGFDAMLEKAVEADKSGIRQTTSYLEIGKQYRPPDDLQSDLFKMQAEPDATPPTNEEK
jgi:hypothetical protein